MNNSVNGSANGFAGALFFALVSIGVIFSVGDIIGWIVGAVSAVFSAVSLRHAFIQAAEAAEEDHQRMEIQFQQLRQKVGESSASSSMAMRSIAEVSETMQENLQGMRTRLAELDNLQIIAETGAAMGAALKSIEDNTKLTEQTLREVSKKLAEPSGDEELKKLTQGISKNLETLCTLGENNKAALQTGIKLMQVFGQILKNPSFAKDLGKISESTEKVIEKINALDEIQKSLSESKIELSALSKILEEISDKNSKMESTTADSAENFKVVGEKIISTNENLTEMFDNVRKEISALTKKIEAYNGLTKATLEQYSNLTAQDIRVLEKIAGKING